MDTINTESAPAAIGPYSQAVTAGNFVFCSGQVGLDPQSGKLVSSDVEAQTHQVMANLKEVLLAAGVGFSEVVKTSIFLRSLENFSKVNEIYATYMSEPFPARATIEVSRLPLDAEVEIEMIAVNDKR